MFPKSEGDTIETISEQLGAYRDIKEKIDVLENKIGMLKKVREAGQKLTMTRADIVKQQAVIRCIDIEDLKNRIDALLQDQDRTQERLRELRQQEEELEALSAQLENELILVSADLKSSDLGNRQERLEELEKRSRMLADNAAQWRKILQGLRRWESDEIVAAAEFDGRILHWTGDTGAVSGAAQPSGRGTPEYRGRVRNLSRAGAAAVQRPEGKAKASGRYEKQSQILSGGTDKGTGCPGAEAFCTVWKNNQGVDFCRPVRC